MDTNPTDTYSDRESCGSFDDENDTSVCHMTFLTEVNSNDDNESTLSLPLSCNPELGCETVMDSNGRSTKTMVGVGRPRTNSTSNQSDQDVNKIINGRKTVSHTVTPVDKTKEHLERENLEDKSLDRTNNDNGQTNTEDQTREPLKISNLQDKTQKPLDKGNIQNKSKEPLNISNAQGKTKESQNKTHVQNKNVTRSLRVTNSKSEDGIDETDGLHQSDRLAEEKNATSKMNNFDMGKEEHTLEQNNTLEQNDMQSEQLSYSNEQMSVATRTSRSDISEMQHSLYVQTSTPQTPESSLSLAEGIRRSAAFTRIACDVCQVLFHATEGIYCGSCLQRLCSSCSGVHGNLSATSDHIVEQIAMACHRLPIAVTQELSRQHGTISEAASQLQQFTRMQVSLNTKRSEMDLATMDKEELEVAKEVIEIIIEQPKVSGMSKTLRNGGVEWTFTGEMAGVVKHFCKNNVSALVATFDYVSVFNKQNGVWKEVTYDNSSVNMAANEKMGDLYGRLSRNTEATISIADGVGADNKDSEDELIIRTTDFGEYVALRDIVDELMEQINGLFKAEVARPLKDELRMRLYLLTKEANPKILCTIINVGMALKLVIRGLNKDTVMETKEEFLSIFCKECSVCLAETARPMYLDCKHIMCQGCVHHSANLNNGMKCPVCEVTGQVTPVLSLQAQCVDLLEEYFTGNQDSPPEACRQPTNNRKARATSKSSQHSTHTALKIPKYLLKRWSQRTGGLQKLKSIIVNDYGLQIGGSEDSLKIYGEKSDILELAIQSVGQLHEKQTDSKTSRRLIDKCVEWRFRDSQAKMVYNLFSKELKTLQRKFKTVAVKVFPGKYPSVVEIRCGYWDYEGVRYEVDEIENGVQKLFQDEAIQPRTFYYNKKVTEFLDSKRADVNVFCELSKKNNLNVVVFKARHREYITSAKDELSKW